MEGYSIEERVQFIKFYYQNQCSVRQTLRALRNFYPHHNRPAESTIRRLVAKFESTGSVNNQRTSVRHRNARSAENIAAVRESVRENPRQSISRLSQELGVSATSTWRILRRDLGLRSEVLFSQPRPTVVPRPNFDASEDSQALRATMKGFGTNEQAIIDILTARSNRQRQEIKEYFLREYGRDLIEDLKSELRGNFESVIIALMTPPVQYLCKQLHKTIKGGGTDEETLVEIICSKTNDEIKEIVAAYEDMYERPLAEHLCSETSSHFRRLLTLIITEVRDPIGTIDPYKAREQAEALYAAGETKLGTDEEVFNRIMAHCSFEQLQIVFEEYKNVSGITLEQAIKHEMSSELHDVMIAIVECIQSQPEFFAKRLQKSMDSGATDDTSLIRIIVSRSEVDLGNIKDEFERIYDKTLLSAVKNETSGDYKRALCALIGIA